MNDTPAAKLRALKIRLSVDEVAQIVQRLVNGETVYQIGKPGTRGHAKATVGKINTLRLAGQLNFLVDALYEQDIARAAINEGKEIGGDHWSSDAAEPGGLERNIQAVLAGLPEVEWDVGTLKACGFETEQALSLLLQHDELEQRRAGWKSSDLRKYAEYHLLVDFMRRHQDRTYRPPLDFARLAAEAKAAGIVDNNRSLRQIGENIIRYQVWHGGQYRAAFEQAQIVTTRSARALKARYGHRIDYFIDGGIGETFMPLLPMPEQG
jgi:hypothetical protein